MKKRKLEIEALPGEESPEGETRYSGAGRRLEIRRSDGEEHPEFSHERNTVQIDQSGMEEYKKAKKLEGAVQSARMKVDFERRKKNLDRLFELGGVTPPVDPEAGRRQDRYWRMAKIALRLVAGSLMIYIGILGIFNLVDLYLNPPAQGVSWRGFFGFPVLAVLLLVASYYRRAMVQAKDNPEHWIFKSHPQLRHPPTFEKYYIICQSIQVAFGAWLLLSMIL